MDRTIEALETLRGILHDTVDRKINEAIEGIKEWLKENKLE